MEGDGILKIFKLIHRGYPLYILNSIKKIISLNIKHQTVYVPEFCSEDLERVRSRSLEPLSGLAMWSDHVEYIQLLKEDRGLGFSILDYLVRYCVYYQTLAGYCNET